MNLTEKYHSIDSENFILRPFTYSDSIGLFHLLTNDDVLKYFSTDKLKSLEDAQKLVRDYLEGVKSGSCIRWVISDKRNESFMGMIGFRKFVWEHFRAELGYGLLPEFWGKGIISKAIPAIVNFGFDELNLHSIEANVDPKNNASMKVLEKSGFTKEAHFSENYFFGGKFWDTVVFSLINKNARNENHLN